MKCNSKVTTVQEVKYPFTYHSDGFYRIGLVGEHKNVHTLALEIATYLEYDTLIIASNTIRKLPDNYSISGASRNIIFSNNSDIYEIQKVINTMSKIYRNVVTICDSFRDTSRNKHSNKNDINLTGHLIYIYGSDIGSINVNNIVMPKNCSNDIKKRVHVYCNKSDIKLLKFDSFCSQLSDISDANMMVINNSGVYECADFTDGVLRCSEIDKLHFETNFIMDVFSKVKNHHKSIVLCGNRGTGKTLFVETYIKYAGTEYDKCMFIDHTSRLSDFIFSTGCSYISTPDISEIVNFSRSHGKKLLVFDDVYFPSQGGLFTLYSTLVCNRHLLNLTIILSRQPANKPDIFHLKHDHYVIFRHGDVKNLHNSIGGYYPSFDVFRRDHDIITSNFGAMVINNISTDNYRAKTFAVRADAPSMLYNTQVEFTPHKLINNKLSVTRANIRGCSVPDIYSDDESRNDSCNSTIQVESEWTKIGMSRTFPHTLITGQFDKCFNVYKSYANHIDQYHTISRCHVFVSPEIDNTIIKELDDANCCVHYGYDTDELADILKYQADLNRNKKTTSSHVCVIVPYIHESFNDFLKHTTFHQLIFNGRHNRIYLTLINPTGKSVFPPAMRNNFDFIISNYTSDYNELKILYSFHSMYPTLKIFTDAIKNTYSTDSNKTMVLVSRSTPCDVKFVNSTKILTIDKHHLNKRNNTHKCNRKYTSSLDKCIGDLDHQVESSAGKYNCYDIANTSNTKSDNDLDNDNDISVDIDSDTDNDISVDSD